MLWCICLFSATAQGIYNSEEHVEAWSYLHWHIEPAREFFVKLFYTLLVHASFIPVSLYVSMAICRFFQSYFMMCDLDMYHEASDCAALVRTMMLNEQLGQTTHIFTDKTGT